ncbi:MAG: hypothetical protein ACXVXH_14995 [Nocardioidaceae bacterium]
MGKVVLLSVDCPHPVDICTSEWSLPRDMDTGGSLVESVETTPSAVARSKSFSDGGEAGLLPRCGPRQPTSSMWTMSVALPFGFGAEFIHMDDLGGVCSADFARRSGPGHNCAQVR